MINKELSETIYIARNDIDRLKEDLKFSIDLKNEEENQKFESEISNLKIDVENLQNNIDKN